jgi:hypothetical protein
LDLTPDLASLALRRIAVLKEQRNLDPDIDETYYWAYFVDCYFDPWAESAEDVKEGEGTNSAVGDTLDELKIEDNGVVSVPENFHVACCQYAVECEQMIVRALCGRLHNRRYVGLVKMWLWRSKPAVFDMLSSLNTT